LSRRVSVELIVDYIAAQRGFAKAGAAGRTFERDLSKASRGALAGSGVFKTMGRSIAFASGGFLAFASAGEFIRKSVDAAVEAQQTQRQLAAQFKASGVSLAQYQGQIDRTNLKLSALSGFTKDDLDQSFITLFRNTGNVAKSFQLNALAADLARGRHMDLSKAAILVGKVAGGNVSILRRYGLEINKNATASQALAFLQQKYAGQARAGATVQQRFGAVMHDSMVIIGTALLPTINRLTLSFSAWLTKMNESGRLQRDVSSAAKFLARALSGIIAGARTLKWIFDGLGTAVGGTKHEFELLIGVWAGWKATKLVAELRGVAAALGLVANSEKAAESTSIWSLLGAAPGALAAGGVGLAAIAEAYGIYQGVTAPKSATYGAPQQYSTDGKGNFYRIVPTRGPQGPQKVRVSAKEYYEATGKTPPASSGVNTRDRRTAPNRGPIVPSATLAAAHRRGLSLQGQFNLAEYALAKAGLTKSQADDRAALETEARILRLQIAQAKKLKDKLALTQQLGSVVDQINSIDQQTADAEKKRKKAAEKAKKAAEQYATPLALQLAEAKANAIAPGNSQQLTAGQIKVEKAIRAAAYKALKSGKLAIQGQIDAWNTIAQVNSQLSGQTKSSKATYHAASTSALLSGVQFATANDRKLAQERLAASEAHRGYLPNGPAAQGQVVINGPVSVHARNIDELASQLDKVGRRRTKRRGGR